MKNLSDAALAAINEKRLDELRKFVVLPAATAEPVRPQPRGQGQATPQGQGTAQEQPTKSTTGLPDDETAYLETALKYPFDTVTQRAKRLSYSAYKSDQVKKSVIAKGLAIELPMNFGKATGGLVKLLRVTDAGYVALGKVPPERKKEQGSPEHALWQEIAVEGYSLLGFKAKIEMCVEGKCADVGFIKDGKPYAVEIELRHTNAVQNVKQDLVGFEKVLVAAKNQNVKQAIEDDFRQFLSDEERARVSVILLSEFSFVKDILRGKETVGTSDLPDS